MDKIIMEIIITVAVAAVWYAWHRYIRPWLETNHLMEAATIAVSAAEALYGRYHGAEKLEVALAQLKEAGWDITRDDVLNAVRAAWQKMNTSQIAAGEKKANTEDEHDDDEEEEDEGDADYEGVGGEDVPGLGPAGGCGVVDTGVHDSAGGEGAE